MSKKIVIVGGVAGGASAAARLRRLDEKSHIVMFEKGEYISFANCGLPYYIGGTIKNRNDLLVQTVDSMSSTFNLDIRNNSEVISINRDQKTVKVLNILNNNVYEESYDTLVLSPGSYPILPTITTIDKCNNLFTLRNIPDTDKIINFIKQENPNNAIIIGGGFIGIEMAENLHARNISVILVEMTDQIFPPADLEMAAILHNYLREKKINLILNNGVKEFLNNGYKVKLNDDTIIDTDMIIVCVGVKPDSKLAENCGLELGENSGIRVNPYLQTSDPNIYAIGDAIEVTNYINKKPTTIPLAWPASRQGRIVADNIYGNITKYKGTLGTSIVKVFDITTASTGLNEKHLKKLDINYQAIHIHPASHARYYPNATNIALKLLFDPKSGKIFGAQAIGIEGIDKRIDVLSTAIKGELTIYDLQEIELAYAPPFSSSKDPVNMLGYVASNIIDNTLETFQWFEVNNIIENDGYIIDVRTPEERLFGYLSKSVNIPLNEIRYRLHDIPKEKQIYVYCQVGLRGYLACRILQQNGYKVKNLDGGIVTYNTVYGAEYVETDERGVAQLIYNK